MRVTQGMMFSTMNYNMNKIFSDSMESNMQGATQKRINRPSDDPSGTIKVMNYRASLASTEQYIDNSADADSWLKSTGSALQQTTVILGKLRELAEQAATGTLTAENRLAISYEVNEMFDQLINLSNTEFAGSHLFSGHKTSGGAYERALTMDTDDPDLQDIKFKVDGDIDRTTVVRFPAAGEIGGDADLIYEFSDDGGETWTAKTLPGGEKTLDFNGSQIEFFDTVDVKASDPNGTTFTIHPTALYKGDDNDPPPEVDVFGKNNIDSAKATGHFSNNVQIRLESDAKVNTDGTVDYSYSSDNGLTWKTGQGTTSALSDSVRLLVDGGYVDVKVEGDKTLDKGQQLVIRPNRASDMGYEISEGEYLDVTNSGKDIFGGIYQEKDENFPSTVEGPNIFDAIGRLIAATETNDSEACSAAIKEITELTEHLLTQEAKVGGKQNRLSLNISILQSNTDDQKSRMSSLEDIDIGALTIKMNKEALALEAVLKSSSMIMNMTLMDFI